MTFEELRAAAKLLGLGSRASLTEIKSRYRQLAKDWHPDADQAEPPDRIRSLNAAYRLLTSYAETYPLSFSEEAFVDHHLEERVRRQFEDDPLWGDPRP